MRTARARAFAALAAALLASGPALAVDASTYLIEPIVTAGERELDARMGAGSRGRSITSERDAGIGLGMGLTQRWFSEIAVQYRQASAGSGWDALDWENVVQLAEQGEWMVDTGILLEIEVPRDRAEGDSLRAGVLLQKDLGYWQVNFNTVATRHFDGSEFRLEQWRYQFQAKYRLRRPLEFGVQAFGSLSAHDRLWVPYERQSHRVGPVVLGRFTLSGERSIGYNAAFLLGTTGRSPDRTVRCQLEYEF